MINYKKKIERIKNKNKIIAFKKKWRNTGVITETTSYSS